MKKHIICTCAISIFAGLIQPLAAEPLRNLNSIAGEYKESHEIEIFMGEQRPAEVSKVTNSLTINKLSVHTATIETELQFDQGHVCHFSGTANLEDGVLVHREKVKAFTYDREKKSLVPVDAECVLSLALESGHLVFHDAGGICRQRACGARGELEGISFNIKTRH